MPIPPLARPLAAFLATALFAAASTTRAAIPDKPNIVLILCDDAGFADFGCFGGDVPTPHIDRLATEGIRFTNFYNESRCMPTRGSLMTGLYANQAFSDQGGIPVGGYTLGNACTTIPELLKPLGYATYMVGKWHLGEPRPGAAATDETPIPTRRGFDKFHGIWSGAISFSKEAMAKHPNNIAGRNFIVDMERPLKTEELPDNYYTTFSWTEKAIEYIEATPASQPFFLYAAYTAPHWPLSPKPDYLKKAEALYGDGPAAARERIFRRQKEIGLWPDGMRMAPFPPSVTPPSTPGDLAKFKSRMVPYYASIMEMDDAVGTLLDCLERTGRDRDTLVFFLSDNGSEYLPTGAGDLAVMANTPFYGGKLTMYRGGSNTAFIARWPARIPAGTINRSQVAHVKDCMATFLDAAGGTYPTERKGKPILPMEGRSFLPALRDPSHADNEDTICWEHEVQKGILCGRWRMVMKTNWALPGVWVEKNLGTVFAAPERPMNEWELYDLQDDPTECRNLAPQQTERVVQLAKRWEAWAARTSTQARIDRLLARAKASGQGPSQKNAPVTPPPEQP